MKINEKKQKTSKFQIVLKGVLVLIVGLTFYNTSINIKNNNKALNQRECVLNELKMTYNKLVEKDNNIESKLSEANPLKEILLYNRECDFSINDIYTNNKYKDQVKKFLNDIEIKNKYDENASNKIKHINEEISEECSNISTIVNDINKKQLELDKLGSWFNMNKEEQEEIRETINNKVKEIYNELREKYNSEHAFPSTFCLNYTEIHSKHLRSSPDKMLEKCEEEFCYEIYNQAKEEWEKRIEIE